MAFEGLSSKLQNVFKKLSGKGKLSEKDVKEAMREVKLALLEADVNFTVVKSFVNAVTERAVGAEVLESLTPGQQVIKIVNEEMTKLMGGTNAKVEFGSTTPAVILLAGLQGAGKTTMAGKLAAYLSKQYGKSPLLVACDIYRPAAIKQLQVVGEKAGVPVFERGQSDPVETAKLGIEYARRNLKDLVIIDTAGRLHIDGDMMAEIAAVRKAVNPSEILLVIDAMTGQDAVNVAKAFNYGAGKPKRVRQGIVFISLTAVGYSLLVWLLVRTIPGPLISIFNSDPDLIAAGIPALRLYFCAFFLMALQFAGQSTFVSLGKSKQAIFFSIFRKVIIVVPLTLWLPHVGGLGVSGVFWAEAISNVIGGVFCFGTMLVTVFLPLGKAADGRSE